MGKGEGGKKIRNLFLGRKTQGKREEKKKKTNSPGGKRRERALASNPG